MVGNGNKRRRAGEQRKRGFPEHRRTLYWFRRDVMREGADLRRCTWSISNENRIGLVNGSAVSIHHVGNAARFCPVAFILRERRGNMVNRR
ncbi:hypothetical protein [Bradyrhizobium viridifuturi]|uniref:hypothetical protein n=1 Tax=Bradyrhizobium viridifuturi TaxID=1654716 RepID=UPI000AC40D7B|nr:hypothetical protein [Bradyrhizobium viridifuturi]